MADSIKYKKKISMNFEERKKKELESDFKKNSEMKTNNSLQNSLIKQQSNDKIRNSFQNKLTNYESNITKSNKKKLIIDKFSNFYSLNDIFKDTLDFYSQKLKNALDNSINILKMNDYQVILISFKKLIVILISVNDQKWSL